MARVDPKLAFLLTRGNDSSFLFSVRENPRKSLSHGRFQLEFRSL